MLIPHRYRCAAYVAKIFSQINTAFPLNSLARRSDGLSAFLYDPVDDIHITPLPFPIMDNRLPMRVSSEKLADRVKRMQLKLEKIANT